jgi:hypothetical protein
MSNPDSTPRVTSILALVRAAYQQGFERATDENVWFDVSLLPLPSDDPGVLYGTLVIYSEIRGPVDGGPNISAVRVVELSGLGSARPEVVDHHISEMLPLLIQRRAETTAEEMAKIAESTAQPTGSGLDPDLGRLATEYSQGR